VPAEVAVVVRLGATVQDPVEEAVVDQDPLALLDLLLVVVPLLDPRELAEAVVEAVVVLEGSPLLEAVPVADRVRLGSAVEV
jgi:hypothetical protein